MPSEKQFKTNSADTPSMRDIVIIPRDELVPAPILPCCSETVLPHEIVPYSGRKDRVLIACLSLDVPLIVDPAVFYKAERIHLLSYDSGDSPIYEEFRRETVTQLRERLPDVCIVDHGLDISDYRKVLREMLTIVRIDEDEFTDIYVNISSGTPEYSAAAMLLCMQYSDLTAFTVRAKERALKEEDIRRHFYRDGRPVGDVLSTEAPAKVVTFDPEKQDMDLITAMAVIEEYSEKKSYVTFEDIIDGLTERGVWRYTPNTSRNRTNDLQKKRMHFRRNYIAPMVEKGWLTEDPIAKRRFRVTEKGQAVIDVYHGLDERQD